MIRALLVQSRVITEETTRLVFINKRNAPSRGKKMCERDGARGGERETAKTGKEI